VVFDVHREADVTTLEVLIDVREHTKPMCKMTVCGRAPRSFNREHSGRRTLVIGLGFSPRSVSSIVRCTSRTVCCMPFLGGRFIVAQLFMKLHFGFYQFPVELLAHTV
jgi:hypothetical protein